jgi:2,4-diaminopentanoate dehydrogenase
MARVVQWATGSMGRTALRRVIDSSEHELVGVYVYSSKKAGEDAGGLARRPDTGIAATNLLHEICALDADVVLHTPRITLPYEALVADVERLLESGKNVVSTAGFHWPAAHGEAYASRLHNAALKGGATLAGVGVNPGLVMERIALAATAMCHELDLISIAETVDASGMESAEFVFGLMGLGSDPAEKDIREGPLARLYGTLFSEVLHFAAAEIGSRVVEIVPDHRLTLAPADMNVKAGPIRKGTVAATEWRWLARTEAGPELLLSILWTADPKLHGERSGHWTIEIGGRPRIRMTMDIEEADPAMPPSRALTDAVIAVAIRAIPDVIAAPPGFFAYRPPAAWRKAA